jgi:DNA-binding NtrC family response regulator
MDVQLPFAAVAFTADLGCAIGSDVNVLISGGDVHDGEAVARLIHERSHRRAAPFVVVGPAASAELLTPAELVRKSYGGTLFIEEAGALDRETQAELLGIVTGPTAEPTDACAVRGMRVIVWTSFKLLRRLASREFRADLFYRLNVVHVVLGRGRTQPAARVM